MLSDKSAVLLITFNRPDTTKIVFEAIRAYRPEVLYVFSDGPRADRYEADSKLIEETRAICKAVDWDGKLVTRFMDENQGCGAGVSGAISWAFETEEKLIILEDDCVPSLSFFSFCNNLLEEHKCDSRVMHIAGTRWNEEFKLNAKNSYFYSKYAHIWGWATWKRAWNNYDFQMKDWPNFKNTGVLNKVLNNYFPLVKRWDFMFDNIYKQTKKHTWDYQWQFTMFKNNGLCITPMKNLVTNIGDVGVHFSETTSAHHRERNELDEKLVAPKYYHAEYDFDEYHGKTFFLNGRSKPRLIYDQLEGFFKRKIKS